MSQTVEELSASLAAAIGRFEAEEMGARATGVTVMLQDDLVVVHLKGVLSPSERDLAQTQFGQAILQRFNTMLFGAGSSPSIRAQVATSLGRQVADVQTALSPLTGSLVVVFELAQTAAPEAIATEAVATESGVARPASWPVADAGGSVG